MITTRNFITVFVQWKYGSGVGTYKIIDLVDKLDENGTFTCKPSGIFVPEDVFIGGRADKTSFFNGYLTAVEVYTKKGNEEKDDGLPDAIKNLLVSHQLCKGQ